MGTGTLLHAVRPLRAATVVVVALLASAAGSLPASADSCSGSSTSWTGGGDAHSWTDPLNWDAGSPTDSGTATVPAGATAVDGVTGSVCALAVLGPATGSGPALTGDLTVTNDLSLSGASSWTGALSSLQAASLAPATDLLLGDGSVLTVSGTGQLGAGALVHAVPSPTTAPTVVVPGALSIGGAGSLDGVALRLVPKDSGGAGSLDLVGATLTLTGPAVSTLREGTTLSSTSGNGALVVSGGARVVPTTGATVGANTSLRIASGGVLGADGGAATLSGSGTLDWVAGAVAGDLTLAVPTVLDGGGTRVLPAESTVVSSSTLYAADGTLDLRGTLLNQGTVTLRPGVTLQGTPGLPSALRNPAGSTLSLDGTSGNGGSVVLDGVHLVNAGALALPVSAQLRLSGSAGTATSDLLAGGTLTAPATPTDGSTPGTLRIGHGSTVRLSGSTSVTGARVQLDDGTGTGDGAQLVQGDAAGTLTGPDTGAGSFLWTSGTVAGAVTVSKLTSDIGSGATGTRRVVQALDDTHPGVLTLGGTAALNASTLELAPAARLVVAGTLSLASAPGGIAASGGLSGQQVVVATGATLRHVAQSTTSTGSSNSTAPMTIAVPLLNQGTVSVETSLNVPAGYTQDVAPGAAANAELPVTGVFSGAVLSASDGVGAVAPITLVKGGLGGTGTVEAHPLTTGAGFVHPGTSTTTGTLTVKGDMVLGTATDLQVVLRSATDHDVLAVKPLTVGSLSLPGSLQLHGNLTGVSQNGFNPAYGTRVTGLVTAAVRAGTFASGSSSGLSNGYGWRPAYPATPTVDLTVVDVAPPALGIAGIPAFTQLASQRFTYSAVDNKAGVASFDVRWMRSATTGGLGGWHYPAGWQGTTATNQTLGSLAVGYTYCFSVRARDRLGNLSGWSQPLCTAKMMDDRALSASAGWTRPGGLSGYYFGTYSRTLRAGAYLRRAGTFTRVAVTAQRCPGCGTFGVYSGSTRLGTVNLNGPTGLTSWVSPVLSNRTATVYLKVANAGKGVTIDGFGLAR